MKYFIRKYISAAGLVFFLVFPLVTIAQANTVSQPQSNVSYSILNPLNPNITSVSAFVTAVLQAVTTIGIPIAALFIVYAGFKFVTAQGNEDKLKKAKDNLLHTFIGIALFLAALLIANVISATVKQLGVGI